MARRFQKRKGNFLRFSYRVDDLVGKMILSNTFTLYLEMLNIGSFMFDNLFVVS